MRLDVEAFIARWTGREGGAERANYQMFLAELCDVIAVPRLDPAGADTRANDYVFERAVRPRDSDGGTAPKRIDLYKRGHFILEAKQSRLPGQTKALAATQLSLLGDDPEQLGRRGTARGWDVMMQNARRQAEAYVFLLEPEHAAPPFLITCDVGHGFEVFSDSSGTGRAYVQFPDRKGFRIFLEDLRDATIRDRLKAIWTAPLELDPARHAARVTREIAARLAAVSKALETSHPPEDVAHFLMRCIFTMFAEDVDLLPKGGFSDMLADCLDSPDAFAPLVTELWAKMDAPERSARFFAAFRTHLRHFNGNLFAGAKAFPLAREEIGELLAAARANWTEVDPAIFGTLLEQALDKTERKKLGAHYTPRAYVQRLVEATVMEPLRADWQDALKKAEDAKQGGDEAAAVAHVRAFHRTLCATRVLDPACGTGNFLYVALELMTALEGEVMETLARLGEAENMGLDRETVDPHQFLGLELNPRAAAIASLVVWIGYLQQHYRTRSGHPAEPILRAFANINFGRREGYDAVLTWDGYPLPTVATRAGKRIETYPNARRPDWPDAEFIVGNPPFVGGKDIRARLAQGYAEALWAAHPQMNESADYVLYWWDRAAERLTCKRSSLRRFGLVTTNSIRQVLQRRVLERHLSGKSAISLVFAVPDHPWTKAGRDAAAVRIAMTVAQAGVHHGILRNVVSELDLDSDEPKFDFTMRMGRIHSDLTIGVDVTMTRPLVSSAGLCSPGVKLHSSGFIVSREHAETLGFGVRPGVGSHLRPYRNGRDLAAYSRDAMVIDLFGLSSDQVRNRFPEIYQHLLTHVRPSRERNNRSTYKKNWWIFGEPRIELRSALEGLRRSIVTIETTKHRIFQFLDIEIIPDNMLVVIAIEDAATLSILSSRIHMIWSPVMGGWLGYGNDPRYSKSRCFDPFPFPLLSNVTEGGLCFTGEELDATRKAVLADHPDLTLTGLYNVLEKIRVGASLDARDEDVKTRGRVLILRELHDTIDRLTADAYGWPHDLSDEDILARLVALNAERVREEAAGRVRWLRPDYQIPRFAKGAAAKTGEFDLGGTVVAIDTGLPPFPVDRGEQPLAVEAVLRRADRPLSAADISRGFKRGGRRIEARVAQILATLSLYGHILEAGEGRFLARRAA